MTTQDAREQLAGLVTSEMIDAFLQGLKDHTVNKYRDFAYLRDGIANALALALTDDTLPLLINAIGRDRLLEAMGGERTGTVNTNQPSGIWRWMAEWRFPST